MVGVIFNFYYYYRIIYLIQHDYQLKLPQKLLTMLQQNDNIGQWPMIPTKAFLFFPTGPEIKQGSEQKQWRKIFEDGSPYDTFQTKKLDELDKKLKQERIVPHPWFDRANLLRFLQANKFKIDDTCKSIKEGSHWREKYFPVKANPEANLKLNEGTLYFCGRDREYRPILVIEIIKMKKYSEQIVPVILNTLLEYCLEQLLIPGQVQNYVLIINLDGAGFSDKSSVGKIVSFTSNTYRSRLYASYLLNTPFLIAKGWSAFASALVSENTLRKIKISENGSHADMWLHMDKEIVEEKYGGTMGNLKAPFWPPQEKLMNWTSRAGKLENAHVTRKQYNEMYRTGKLKNRKIKQQLLDREQPPTNQPATPLKNPLSSSLSKIEPNPSPHNNNITINRLESPYSQPQLDDRVNPAVLLPASRVRQEVLPPIRKRQFRLFFEDEKFKALFFG